MRTHYMPTHQHTPSIPLELVGEVLGHLSPKVSFRYTTHELWVRRVALARCARACRPFQTLALTVLWEDMRLTNTYRAPLSRYARQTAFEDYGDEEEDWLEGVDARSSRYAYVRLWLVLRGDVASLWCLNSIA